MPIIFLVMLIVPSLFARDSDAIYGVIDRSGWVHDAVRKTIVERDIEQFLTVFESEIPTVYDEIKDSEVREDLRTAVNNGLSEDNFRRELRDMIVYLTTQNGQLSNPTKPSERIANWWVKNTETVAGIAPWCFVFKV